MPCRKALRHRLNAITALAALVTVVLPAAPVRAEDQPPADVSPPSFNAPRPATRPVGVTIEEILKGLVANETGIRTLHIKHFDCTRQTLAAGGANWQSIPWRLSGSAWYESPGDRCRIYFSKQVMAWVDGDAPWAETELDISYDGTEGRVAHIRSGSFGKPLLRERDGQRFPHRPPTDATDRFTACAIGKTFSLAFFRMRQDNIPLSAFLRQTVDSGHPPELAREVVNGFDTVRLLWHGPLGNWRAFWLAPDKGYALIRHEMLVFPPDQGDTENVTRLKEVSPGLWFPTAGVWDVRGSAGSRDRYTYTAEDVIANDPKFDPAIFTLHFASGFLVNKAVGNGYEGYVVREDGTTRPSSRGTAITERVGTHEIPEP